MAKVNMGILGGFIGKVGTVVGFKIFGKQVMRAYQRAVKNPRTAGQRLVRAKFGKLTSVGASMLEALKIGMAATAVSRKMTPMNVFVQKNWGAANGADAESVAVDYSGLKVSLGRLPMPVVGELSFDEELTVKLAFTPRSDMPGASADDSVYMVAYQPESNTSVTSAAARRDAGVVRLTVPGSWSGCPVHVYVFAIGKDGKTAESVYAGTGNIG